MGTPKLSGTSMGFRNLWYTGKKNKNKKHEYALARGR
jgi:hypothetical protein